MIDIPINKALVAVPVPKGDCHGCISFKGECLYDMCNRFACSDSKRRDGKNVIFKLVDMSEGSNGNC